MPRSLFPDERRILLALAECQKNKGRILEAHDGKSAAILLRRGLVMTIRGGPIFVHIITEAGREQAEKLKATCTDSLKPAEKR